MVSSLPYPQGLGSRLQMMTLIKIQRKPIPHKPKPRPQRGGPAMLISKPLSREELSLQAFPPGRSRGKRRSCLTAQGRGHSTQCRLSCSVLGNCTTHWQPGVQLICMGIVDMTKHLLEVLGSQNFWSGKLLSFPGCGPFRQPSTYCSSRTDFLCG